MKFRPGCVLATLCLLLPTPLSAQHPLGECVIGPGFGATLLYPYFETDLNSFSGPATLLSFNNGQSTRALVRVILWTDLGYPTLGFDVYMPPFSLSSLNMRDVMNGGIPSTGDGVDLSAFEGCDENPPFHSNPALTSRQVSQLRADHTGQEGPSFGNCVASESSDGIARGYVTIDVVDECSGIEVGVVGSAPWNDRYFADGASSGIAINQNRLWGDVFYLSNDTASAHGSAAIPLWADADLFSGDGIFTFYGKFSNWDGRDNRVPLPSIWNARFINGGPFAGGASLITFHDSGLMPTSVPCGNDFDGFPLQGFLTVANGQGEDQLTLHDEFPLIAGLVSQRGSISDLSIPYPFGWLQMNPASDGVQSWVQPTLSAAGVYSASIDATPVGSTCTRTPPSSVSSTHASAVVGVRPPAEQDPLDSWTQSAPPWLLLEPAED